MTINYCSLLATTQELRWLQLFLSGHGCMNPYCGLISWHFFGRTVTCRVHAWLIISLHPGTSTYSHIFAVLRPTHLLFVTKQLLWIQFTRNPMKERTNFPMDQWRHDYPDPKQFPCEHGLHGSGWSFQSIWQGRHSGFWTLVWPIHQWLEAHFFLRCSVPRV